MLQRTAFQIGNVLRTEGDAFVSGACHMRHSHRKLEELINIINSLIRHGRPGGPATRNVCRVARPPGPADGRLPSPARPYRPHRLPTIARATHGWSRSN